MEIVLVRHAQPDWEPEDRAVDDPGLTALGRRQAERLADAMAAERFDVVYVSPTRRTQQTAAPVAGRLGIRPRTQTWLREIGIPSLAGHTGEQVGEFFARARERELEEHWQGLPGGESLRHFYERVSGGIESLLVGDHRLRIHDEGGHRLWQIPASPERALIVGHEGTNALIMSHLLGIEPVPWGWLRFTSRWAGISVLHTVPVAGRFVWALERFNDIAHLEGT